MPDYVDSPTLRHERKHVKQWEKRGVKFALDYFREGAIDACENKYEEQAGYVDGGYPCVP
ncbi:hypothetical protein ABZY45_24400 [Streptomyces sp. NPDC006516]|uniref:hypothetical protein n=1 Tax=Streptomyces sp. NPDC006516 TaxID=3154309 RepID=UPI0033BED9E7